MRHYHGPPRGPSMCVVMYVGAHRGQWSTSGVVPRGPFTFLLSRQGHLLPPGGLQTKLGLLTNRPQGSIGLQPPALELHLGTTISVYFTWLLGAKLKPLWLQGKHLNTWVICPAPPRQHWSHDLVKPKEPEQMNPTVSAANTESVPLLPPLLFIFLHSPRENSEDKYSLQQTSQMTSKWEECRLRWTQRLSKLFASQAPVPTTLQAHPPQSQRPMGTTLQVRVFPY